MKTTTLLLPLSLLFLGCGPNTHDEARTEAPVLQASAIEGERLWNLKNCASCHADDGSSSALGVSRIIPEIGLPRDIENALVTLKHPTSTRVGIMKEIASELSDQNILDLSEYIYTLRQI